MFFLRGSTRSAEAGPNSTGGDRSATSKAAVLLVIQADQYDWPSIFRGHTLRDGRPLRVVQTSWSDIHVHADTYSTPGLCVDVLKMAPTASAENSLTKTLSIKPDFVLVRNEVKTPDFDGRSRLDALLFADVPSANSLESILLFCERPVVQGRLRRIERRVGKDAFPLVDQHFASSYRSFMYGYTFPAVVKVGSAHAGVGKMKIRDHHQMSDFRSVLQMMPNEHCFAEPFISSSEDLRIQKIGNHYRAYRRQDLSGEWKTNTGTAFMEEIDMTDRWRLWADSAAELFGGLDILTVDAIVEAETGREVILEVNGTSSGLHPDNASEDNGHIRDLVLGRMNEVLCG